MGTTRSVLATFPSYLRHSFWPSLLLQIRSTTPCCYRVTAACIILSYQNTDMERDLALLKRAHERSQGQCGDETTDRRARIRIEGPACSKDRNGRVDEFLQSVAEEWGSAKRRQANPCGSKPVVSMLRFPESQLQTRVATRKSTQKPCVHSSELECLHVGDTRIASVRGYPLRTYFLTKEWSHRSSLII